MDLTAQSLQNSADLPLLAGDRVEIECRFETESRIHCSLTLTHAMDRQGGGRAVNITPEQHRRLMNFLDRQSAAAHNSHEPS